MGRWTNWSEGEQAFFDEVREKKKAANGVHSKTGKRGYVGVMRMPNEIMSRKDKYNYRRNGKVRTYRMLVTFEEFKEMDKEKRKEFLVEYLKDHSKTELKSAWGGADIYYYLTQAGLHSPDKSGERMTKKQKTAALLEKEREEIGQAREKMEEDILTAYTAADEAKRELAGMKAEFNIMRQYFKESLEKLKETFEQETLAYSKVLHEQGKELEQMKAYASSMDDSYCKLVEVSEHQEKEIAALGGELERTKAALQEEEKNVSFLTDELTKLIRENDDDFKRLELQIEQAKGFTSITAAAPTSNDLTSKVKGLEIDVTLLKQLAIR